MVSKLQELIASGPNPRYTMKSLVLEHHHEILQARQLMRTWADITEALGLDKKRWKDLSMCFRRVDAGVKAGKLMPSKTIKQTALAKTEVNGPDYGGFDKPKPKRIFDDDPK